MLRNLLIVSIVLFLSVQNSFAQADVTICWDASYSMKNRDLAAEITYLEQYFSEQKTRTVRVLVFSNQILEDKQLLISKGNMAGLKEFLSATIYDGATSYGQLEGIIKTQQALVFTDGMNNLSNKAVSFGAAVQLVNSNPVYSNETLQLLAIVNSGTYVNLLELNYKNFGNTAAVKKTDSIDSAMVKSGIALNEVVVKGEQKTEVEENLVTTAYGKQNKDKIGYAVQSIDDKNIGVVNTNVSTAVQGKFSGVKYGKNQDLSQAVIRGGNTLLMNEFALIVLDGVPLPRSNSANGTISDTSFINPDNIADITVLKGLAATNRFGSEGNNGVILITTKTSQAGIKKGAPQDLALLKNNIYSDKLVSPKTKLNLPYIKALKKAKNVGEAYDIYLKERINYIEKPEFFIDMYRFFIASDKIIANRIASNILELHSENIAMMKAMSFNYLYNDNYEMALVITNTLAEQHPNLSQPYLDKALLYNDVGNHQAALNMFQNIVSSQYEGVNFAGLNTIIEGEIKNLYSIHKAKIDLSKIDAKYLKNIKYDAKIIVDWSDSDAEFVLQFVNPDKRFFKWDHTYAESYQRINKEKSQGFTAEEFQLTGAVKGEWLINATYIGKGNANNQEPLYLKARVYFNYGNPTQRVEHFVLRLAESGDEANLASINIE
jgi:TonB-dependent SusC/RagA subfamily outer membrane receptor